jgi:hypothetical protein
VKKKTNKQIAFEWFYYADLLSVSSNYTSCHDFDFGAEKDCLIFHYHDRHTGEKFEHKFDDVNFDSAVIDKFYQSITVKDNNGVEVEISVHQLTRSVRQRAFR